MVETTVIIDIIVAAVLLAFVFLGARRGLFRSVAGLAILVVSLVGANMAADSLTPMAAGIVQPAIENRVEEKLGEVLPEDMELPEAEDTAMGELLALLGIDADPAEEILERAGEQVRRNGAGAVAAVAVGVAESTIHVAVFLLVFLAAFIVLKLLAHLVDLTLKLPVLSGANALGGAAVGLVSVFCGATNCPVASTFLALELFGGDGLLYFALACGISYMLSGYNGLYSSQTILYSKLKARYINVHTNAHHEIDSDSEDLPNIRGSLKE